MITFIFTLLILRAEAKDVVSAHSLSQLNSAALVLREASDGEKKIGCGIEPSEANQLLQMMEARMDGQKRELLKTPYGKTWPSLNALKKCDAVCECGVMSSLFEAAGPVRHEWEDAYEGAQKKARNQSAAESKRCAQKASWFCASSLLKSIRKEAKEMGVSPTPTN